MAVVVEDWRTWPILCTETVVKFIFLKEKVTLQMEISRRTELRWQENCPECKELSLEVLNELMRPIPELNREINTESKEISPSLL
jgi:hypothetical protein